MYQQYFMSHDLENKKLQRVTHSNKYVPFPMLFLHNVVPSFPLYCTPISPLLMVPPSGVQRLRTTTTAAHLNSMGLIFQAQGPIVPYPAIIG